MGWPPTTHPPKGSREKVLEFSCLIVFRKSGHDVLSWVPDAGGPRTQQQPGRGVTPALCRGLWRRRGSQVALQTSASPPTGPWNFLHPSWTSVSPAVINVFIHVARRGNHKTGMLSLRYFYKRLRARKERIRRHTELWLWKPTHAFNVFVGFFFLPLMYLCIIFLE